ncbi:MAG: hypothetical protein IKZ44_06635 [Clostridia bacterium]|nr:hypothetical protein [Clostridia bacterium]
MDTIQAHDPRKPVYKKPLSWIILVVILIVIAAAVCLLTKPKCRTTVPVASSIPAGEVMQWLDYYSEMPWEETKEIAVDAFPNVTFRWTYGSVEAVEDGATRTLFSGMPVWNVFFTDLTGDGKPELCATVSFGSGMIDDHIVVYDYENRQSYTLWERGTFDYHLYVNNGALYVGKTPYNGDKQIDYGTLTMQDGLLCCRWHSDGSVTPLNRELHESELYGEWIVEAETDNDGNVLYAFDVASTWKEYNFREDGTVTYNETVPISSDYEKAFGHPVTYPYEVHNDYVYIAGDDTSGAFRWGQYDRETRTLTLMYSTDAGTVYAKLRRMGDGAQNEAALDEATLCTIWMLAEVEAPDGSNGSAYSLGLRQYLEFRSDGTVRMVDTNAFTQRIVPYTLNGNTVQFDGRILRYDSEYNELIEIDPTTQDVLSYTPVPDIDAQTIEEMLLGIHTCTGATAGGNETPIPAEYVGMRIDLNDSTSLPDVSEDEYFHIASVTLDGIERTGYDWTVDANDMLTVRNDETGDSWTFQWLEKEYMLLLTLDQTDASGNPIVLIFPID